MHYILAALSYSWVWMSLLVISIVYWHGHVRLNEEKLSYMSHYQMLQDKLEAVKEKQKTLSVLFEHRESYRVIEWELIHDLGLIPEGTTKVVISHELGK